MLRRFASTVCLLLALTGTCFAFPDTYVNPTSGPGSNSGTSWGMPVTGLVAGSMSQTGSMASNGTTLTDTNANWTSAITGDTVCVQKAAAGGGQQCGTATFISSTTLTTSFTNHGGVLTNVQYVLGVLNNSAVTTAQNAAAIVGGTLQFPAGVYLLSTTQSFTCNVAQNWQGAGAGMSSFFNVTGPGGPTTYYNGTGTYLVWASTSIGGPAIQMTSTSGTVCHVPHHIADMVIYGGAGIFGDGGGGDGVDILNQEHIYFDRVVIANWTGLALAVNALSSSTDWTNDVQFRDGGIYYNGSNLGAIGFGGSVAGGTGSISFANNAITGSEILNNYGPGFYFNHLAVESTVISNDNIGWNSQKVAGGCEINVVTATRGGNTISNNHLETFNSGNHTAICEPVSGHAFDIIANGMWGNGGTSYFVNLGVNDLSLVDAIAVERNTLESGGGSLTAFANNIWVDPLSRGCGTNNTGSVGGVDPMCLQWNTSTRPLPTCSTTNGYGRQTSCVSDGNASCAQGTSYTGGSSGHCQVVCNTSGSYIETGALCY